MRLSLSKDLKFDSQRQKDQETLGNRRPDGTPEVGDHLFEFDWFEDAPPNHHQTKKTSPILQSNVVVIPAIQSDNIENSQVELPTYYFDQVRRQ